ncbi:shikimate kinase AroL [Salidesulfovibrio onnuriiensis]|uniref:shikimate kinase AroL n=1 Tax=Salidesulfovibrio onnuriiensis TaxID=2583823 RepID=UPI0011CCB24B|nr:shikimate kinase AroL [Salidesulfovibrio onnuriiensis]
MKNIYLIGPRASGKTTVGKALASTLDRPFVDTDQAFVEQFDQQIADCVKNDGWDVFRKRESDILRTLSGKGGMVVACGGGIVLRDANRQILSRGITIYLLADPEVLAGRLAKDPIEAQRPSLTGKSITDEVQEVLSMRDPMYRECAHVVLHQKGVDAMVREIADTVARIGENS